jgi:hypothetical protein
MKTTGKDQLVKTSIVDHLRKLTVDMDVHLKNDSI